MTARYAFPIGQIANPLYAGAVLSLYTVDANGAKTTTLATLYAAPTGSTTLSNPVTLDSEGKLAAQIYLEVPVIGTFSGITSVPSHDTGVIQSGGIWRGTWTTATVYDVGDIIQDGANGTNTKDLYIVVSRHTSGVWATDSANAAKLALIFDVSAIAGTGDVVGPASAVVGRVATFANVNGKQIQDGGTLLSSLLTAPVGTASIEALAITTEKIAEKNVTVAKLAGLRGFIDGLILSNNVSDANNDIDIAVGQAACDASTYQIINLTSGITKRLDASWAAGTNQGGLDTGVKANSTWYHVWLIGKSADTSAADVLFSTSASAPTLPGSGWDIKRRIGAIRTNGSGNILAFKQYGAQFLWNAPVLDVIGDTTISTSLKTYTITTPTGVRCLATVRCAFQNTGTANISITLFQMDTDTSLGGGASYGWSVFSPAINGFGAGETQILTNTNAQIGAKSSAAANNEAYVATLGWIDPRGRDL